MNPVVTQETFTVGGITVKVSTLSCKINGDYKKYLLSGGTKEQRERVAIYLLNEGFVQKDEKVSF